MLVSNNLTSGIFKIFLVQSRLMFPLKVAQEIVKSQLLIDQLRLSEKSILTNSIQLFQFVIAVFATGFA